MVTFTAESVVEKIRSRWPSTSSSTPDAEAAASCRRRDSLAEAAPRAARSSSQAARLPVARTSSPRELHADWGDAEVWFGDDRCVPADDPRSNQLLVREALLERLVVAADRARDARRRSPPEAAAALYDAALTGEPLDLVLLGLGPDGHTASLFPDAPSLEVRDRLAVVAEPGLEPFVQRITLTIPALEAGRHVVFLAVGEGKATAVRRAFAEEPSTRDACEPRALAGREDDGDSRRGGCLPASRGRDRCRSDGARRGRPAAVSAAEPLARRRARGVHAPATARRAASMSTSRSSAPGSRALDRVRPDAARSRHSRSRSSRPRRSGYGASGRNGGFVSAGIAGEARVYERAQGADGIVRAERAMIDGIDWIGDVVARRVDRVRLGARAAPIASRRARLSSSGRGRGSRGSALAATRADDAWFVTPAEIEAEVRIAGVLGGTYTPHCARADPARLARGLAEACERRGVAIYERSPALVDRAGARDVRRWVTCARTSSSGRPRRSRRGSPASAAATSRSPPTCSRPSPSPPRPGTRSAGRDAPRSPTSATSSSTPSGRRMDGSRSADAG